MDSTNQVDPETINQGNTGLISRLRGDGLTIFSAIGTALTVVSSLQDTLTVATWAKAIVNGFFATATAFWAFVLPFLAVPPQPMDVVFLNLSAFQALLAASSLGHRDRIRWHWREATWAAEGMMLLGLTLALALMMWSGFQVIEADYRDKIFPALMRAIETVKTEAEIEAAGFAALTGMTAFFPIGDAIHEALGYERGRLLDRVETVLVITILLHFVIILLPSALIWIGGACFGYYNDNSRTARWLWLFLGVVAATFVLSIIADLWADTCAAPSYAFIKTICSLL